MIPHGSGMLVFTLLSWPLALGWLGQAVSALRGIAALPCVTGKDALALPLLPPSESAQVAVIVPACNEAGNIEATLRSLLASTGIRLEIIAVDDRSTDATGKRMDEIAAQSASSNTPYSLRVIHISELPAGWLGKPHAMSVAAQQATAPWLLFTDGDVLFQPQAIELALRQAMASNADHLILVPTLILKSIGEAAMLAAMQALSQWTIRLWKVADPSARDFLGVGGFNLVRRDVYRQVGGFEALKMEVLDDMRFGWNIKRAGFAQRVALGPGLVSIRWIKGALAVVKLIEKNGFAIYRYRVGLQFLACFGLAVQVVLPLIAIAAGGWPMVAGLLIYISVALDYQANRRFTRISPWLAVFFAPATAIVLYALMRSMALALARNGVEWRGTCYSLDDLRHNAGRWW